MRLKLLIADDHQLMLEGIRLALADAADIEIVGETSSGAQVLPLVRQTSPDVVLLDLRMPGMDGLRCLESITPEAPHREDRRALGKRRARGDRGGIPARRRGVHPEAHRPGRPRAGDPAGARRQRLLSRSKRGPLRPDVPDSGLTQRESDILKALAEGLSNKQIARQFWLSEQTIKFHLTNIYRKLDVGSRTEAVRHAYENGLIENPMLRAIADSA